MGLRIKDIADKLNISPATVSLVLNNKPGISEETRRKVLGLVEEMGYATNLLSKPALKNNRNIRLVIYKKHGKVVSDTSFFSALMEAIDYEARNQGYNIIVSYINEFEHDNKMEVIRLLEENPPEGVLLLATEMEKKDLLSFKELKLPIVILDNNFELEDMDSIAINNCQGACQAIEFLAQRGHERIGYLHSSNWIHNFEERKEGYIKALQSSGQKYDSKLVFEVESTIEGAYNDMVKLLSDHKEIPTAFFADNDIIAFGAVKALREKGYKIPEQVSVIGFDDMPFCEIIDPPLTTVKVYNRRIGILAVRRLIERIDVDVEERVKIQVSTQIKDRKSVFELSRSNET